MQTAYIEYRDGDKFVTEHGKNMLRSLLMQKRYTIYSFSSVIKMNYQKLHRLMSGAQKITDEDINLIDQHIMVITGQGFFCSVDNHLDGRLT